MCHVISTSAAASSVSSAARVRRCGRRGGRWDPSDVRLSYVRLPYVRLSYVRLSYVRLSYVRLSYVVTLTPPRRPTQSPSRHPPPMCVCVCVRRRGRLCSEEPLGGRTPLTVSRCEEMACLEGDGPRGRRPVTVDR